MTKMTFTFEVFPRHQNDLLDTIRNYPKALADIPCPLIFAVFMEEERLYIQCGQQNRQAIIIMKVFF